MNLVIICNQIPLNPEPLARLATDGFLNLSHQRSYKTSALTRLSYGAVIFEKNYKSLKDFPILKIIFPLSHL